IISRNWLGSSFWRIRVLAVMPKVTALSADLARPSGLWGPWDLAPLRREDSALVMLEERLGGVDGLLDATSAPAGQGGGQDQVVVIPFPPRAVRIVPVERYFNSHAAQLLN